jgi:ABC-2 type transport system permease protein
MQSFRFRQSARIVAALGWSDFVLKYRGSLLGYLWSFVVPLVKFLVILHVFRPFAADIPLYPLYLFLGIVLWEHFSLLTNACIRLPHDKALIIKKIAFPRVLLVLGTGWMHMIILITYLCIFFIVFLLLGNGIPTSAIWYTPLLLVQTSLIALGVGMTLGSYALKFRDIEHLWNVLLTILFWLTPIMYQYQPARPLSQELPLLLSLESVSSVWTVLDMFILFQPLSILIHDARRSILYPDTLGIPSLLHIGVFTLLCAGIFVIGLWIFRRRSLYFIQEY